MNFAIGDPLIYPRHGAGTVVDQRTRRWNGEEVTYLVVDLDLQDLTVWVPEEETDDLGVREPVTRKQARELLGMLADHDVRLPDNFSRRVRLNERRLTDGDAESVAAVVRDLAVRLDRKHLSPTERRLFDQARKMLATELAIALGTDFERALARIEDRLPAC